MLRDYEQVMDDAMAEADETSHTGPLLAVAGGRDRRLTIRQKPRSLTIRQKPERKSALGLPLK